MIDTLIIGGGIAGLSAAAKLSPHGSTTLLEAETATGYHASGRSAAVFLKDYGNAQVRLLNHASEAELQHTNTLKNRTILMVGQASQRDQFQAERQDFQMSEISISDALTHCPILDTKTVTCAASRHDAHDIDTDLLMQSYIKTARAHGAKLHTNARVTQIEKTPNGWHVRANDRDVHAKTIVNAAGAWVDQIAKMAGVTPIGFQPYRRSMARLPAPGGHDVSGWAFMIGTGQSWYAKPDAGKWLISPEDKDPMDPFDAYPDDMVLAEGIARYQDHVTEPVTRLETSWAGLRTFAPDEALVIGRDVNDPSFVWLAGQGGYGFQTAPAASDLLAALLTGQTPQVDPRSYDPARFS